MRIYDDLGNDITQHVVMLQEAIDRQKKLIIILTNKIKVLEKENKKIKKVKNMKEKKVTTSKVDKTDELRYTLRGKGKREGAPAPADSVSGK